MQRLEFLKAGMEIIKTNFLFGVGTGDIEIAFDKQYEKMNSNLSEKRRYKTHNQFITTFIAFGFFGFIWFITALFYPLFQDKKYIDFLFVTFFIIAILSMLWEDTLETQVGATFFSFFYSLFYFNTRDH